MDFEKETHQQLATSPSAYAVVCSTEDALFITKGERVSNMFFYELSKSPRDICQDYLGAKAAKEALEAD
eukprot:1600601-Amphidinium_carterae.1